MPFDVEIIVPAGKRRERLDVFLTHHVENATRTRVQGAISLGLVLVNGKAVRPSHLVSPGEVIHVQFPKPPPQDAQPEDIPLNVVYEDEHLLVVNKPAGMVTHPAHGNYTGTLVNALLHHCSGLATAGTQRAGIVHRLDKGTSGLLVVAKTDAVHAHLSRQFMNRTIRREYHALVWGIPARKSGVIETDVGRSKSDRKKMAVVAEGKHAVTEFSILEKFTYLSLLALKLKTGRTHQIRVHLAHIHHPVFGDPTYGGRHMMYGSRSHAQKAEVQQMLKMIDHQALHARTIGFIHPSTGTPMFFDTHLPGDMSAVIELLRREVAQNTYSGGARRT